MELVYINENYDMRKKGAQEYHTLNGALRLFVYCISCNEWNCMRLSVFCRSVQPFSHEAFEKNFKGKKMALLLV